MKHQQWYYVYDSLRPERWKVNRVLLKTARDHLLFPGGPRTLEMAVHKHALCGHHTQLLALGTVILGVNTNSFPSSWQVLNHFIATYVRNLHRKTNMKLTIVNNENTTRIT